MFVRKNVCIRRNLPGGVMSILFAHQKELFKCRHKARQSSWSEFQKERISWSDRFDEQKKVVF